MSEVLYVIDEADNVIGRATREECHRQRLIHRSVYILLVNEKGGLLVHRRSMSKDVYPGLFTSSATGHVDYGETYDEAARRELMEELRVGAPLEKVGKFKAFSETEREISTLYVCRYGGLIEPDPTEITEALWLKPEEIAVDLASGRRQYTLGFQVAFQEYVRYLKGKGAT